MELRQEIGCTIARKSITLQKIGCTSEHGAQTHWAFCSQFAQLTDKNSSTMGKFINPFTDWGFKHIFGRDISKDLLIDFLNGLFAGKMRILSVDGEVDRGLKAQ